MSSSVPHLLVFSLHPFLPPPPPTPHRAHSTIYYLWLIRFLIHCLVFLFPLSFLSSLSRSLVLIRLPSFRSSCLSLSLFLFLFISFSNFNFLHLYSFYLKVRLKRVGHAGHCLCSQYGSEWTERQVLVGQGAGRARQCQQRPGIP